MAQHSRNYTIQNDLFPAVRSDINNVLAAIASNNSGPIAPVNPSPFQFWADTSTSQPFLRVRNPNNTAWIAIGPLDTNNLGLVTALNAALTGIPTAPTAPTGTATTQIATTAFVEAPAAATWLNVTLLNGFVSQTGMPLQYTRSRGVVHLRGSLQRSGYPGGNLTIGTLPAGWRAPSNFFVPMTGTGTHGIVLNNGNIDFSSPATTGDVFPTFNLSFLL